MRASDKLKDITRLLERLPRPGSFAASRTIAAKDLSMEVKDVGPIHLPLSPATARKLCLVAQPARHGYKDETRLDRRVRNSWEIPVSRISIDETRWQKALSTQLERIRDALGLPRGCRLKAQLHKLLIYEPGQLFLPHQDTEKAQGMIGTLIINLPSRFKGGTLIVRHQDEEKHYSNSAQDLTLVAFYADCYHEIRPVKEGYRVVLTYNLIMEADPTGAAAAAELIQALVRHIGQFFKEPRRPNPLQPKLPRSPPDRLVYLLDHQYTQQGLAWNRLKNADSVRAAALREVAQHLDCEIHLALADVREVWSCQDEHQDSGVRRGRWYRGDEDEDLDDFDDDFEDDAQEDELEDFAVRARRGRADEPLPEESELLDTAAELRHFVGPGRRPGAFSTHVPDEELCYTKPCGDMQPFAHEGYTGNEGGTVEKWYHRAAIVLWPRDRRFILRAKGSPRSALAQIGSKLKAKQAAEALALAEQLLRVWDALTGQGKRPRLLAATLPVAVQLGRPEVAVGLLKPFTLRALPAASVPRFVQLLERFGLPWCSALLREWTKNEDWDYPIWGRLKRWLTATLPSLCQALCESGTDGRTLAREILPAQWACVRDALEEDRQQRELALRRRLLSNLCQPILGLIEATSVTRDADLRRQILEHLMSASELEPLQLHILQAARKRHRGTRLRKLGLKPLHAHLSRELASRLKAPPRARDDWSITAPVGCSCELCQALTRYLRAADQIRVQWPLSNRKRGHIELTIRCRELPVQHTSQQSGTPYTLVLEKTPALFEQEAAERRSWQQELEWLTEQAAAF